MMSYLQRIAASSISLFFFILYIQSPEVEGIGCYVCESVNGSDPKCEDVFDSYEEAYESTCMAFRKERVGKFPASTCLKFAAKGKDDNHNVTIRGCTLGNGDLTNDAEIGAQNHCGWMREIKYQGKAMRGCLSVCHHDGCNASSQNILFISSLSLIFITYFCLM